MVQYFGGTHLEGPIKITDTCNTWVSIIDTVSKAQKSIHIGAFLWREDNLGTELAETLLKAAERGVQITIEKDIGGLYHEWAEQPHQSFFHTQGNMSTYLYTLFHRPKLVKQNRKNTLRQALLSHGNIHFIQQKKGFIDHSKVFVIDDIVILGGMNIGDEYDGKWLDMMVSIESGELSDKIRDILQEPQLRNYQMGEASTLNIMRDIPGSVQRSPHFKQELLRLIKEAEQSIVVLGGYLSDMDIVKGIIQKVQQDSEVKVKIIIPSLPNIQKMNIQAAIRALEAEIGEKIEIIFSADMIHAKACASERELLIGSANFDRVSGILTGEFGITISGNKQILEVFQSYVSRFLEKQGNQQELSALFWERKLKQLIESFLQRHILTSNIFLRNGTY